MPANHVAEAPALLAYMAQFPPDMQQPNLFFGAVRLAGRTASGPMSDEIVERSGAHIAKTIHSRTTQTNEPNRCAALLSSRSGLRPGSACYRQVCLRIRAGEDRGPGGYAGGCSAARLRDIGEHSDAAGVARQRRRRSGDRGSAAYAGDSIGFGFGQFGRRASHASSYRIIRRWLRDRDD